MSRESECEIEAIRRKVEVLRHDFDDIEWASNNQHDRLWARIEALRSDCDGFHSRIKALEALINAQLAPDTAGHPNDGGWFD